MEYSYSPRSTSYFFVRHLHDVSVVYVSSAAQERAETSAAGAGARRTQCLRHVLDELVHGGRGRGRVPQRRAGARLRVGVRRTPVRLHRRLRDRAARRARAGRAVPVQAKCTHRIHGLQRRGSETSRDGTRQAIPR